MKLRSEEYIQGEDWAPWQGDLPRYREILQRRRQAAALLDKPSADRLGIPVEEVEKMELWNHPGRRPGELPWDGRGPAVDFGGELPLSPGDEKHLRGALTALMPWRKGPFRYFGIDIDSEWRSDWKWDRILQGADLDLRGKRIADVGCNNLYYAYRLLAREPEIELLYAIDPLTRYYFSYALNRRLRRHPQLRFDLFGVEDLPLYPGFFDTILYMGILYHRRDPMKSLSEVKGALRKGGQLILESAGIPGKEPVCLFPEDRYMKAPGYWFLPTVSALEAMVRRAGFRQVRTSSAEPLTTAEQRQTPWAVFQSLDHFLDPEDPSKTVEGYPAPLRIVLTARK